MTDYSAMPYRDYLQTEHWYEASEERKRIDGGKCARCGSTDRLEVHHKTYVDEYGASILGRENPELDLITFCHRCHEAVSQPVPRGVYDFTVIRANFIDEKRRLKVVLSVDFDGIAHSFTETMKPDFRYELFRNAIGLRRGEKLFLPDLIGLKGRALIGVKDPQKYNQNNVIRFFIKEVQS